MEEKITRKLTTILAADVEGYTRLMRADEEATLKTLSDYRDVIDNLIVRHDGRVFSTGGDSVLAEFGSAVEAVRCAISLQEDIAIRNAELPDERKLRFRIGVNLGDVMVKGDDLFGDGVNVAARLEGLAEAGGVCISGAVFEQIKHKLSLGFEDMGPQEVKNIAEPVSVYRVLIDESAATLTTPLARASASRRRIVVRGALAAAGVVVLLAGGVGLWSWRFGAEPPETTAQSTAPDTRRIAILPFVNMSLDPKDEYFSDGLTEELISRLSKIRGLRVIARTSIMKYKDANKGIAEIGRELNVGTILEGSVRKAGDQLRITAQLIDVASEAHLWSEDYDRELENVFRIQSDVAEQVAQALRITLTDQDQQRIARPGTTNVEAFELYLEALNLDNKGDVSAAFELLKKAVSLDPEYAEAQAALAGMWTYLYWYVDMPAQEAYRQAIEAAERALALDDSLATAHLALARAKNNGTWDWEGAERAFQQAIALNPSLADAHRTYAHHFLVSAMRRDEDALAEITRALELDPLSWVIWHSAGWVRHHRKEPDQAIANFQRSKDMAPDEPWNYIGIGQNLIFKGQHDAGIAEIQRGIAIAPNNHYLLGFLAWAYGVTDRLDEANKVVEKMKAAAETKEIAPMAFAWAYTGMGDIDNAVAALEEAYQIHDYGAIFIRVPEFYEVLSPDPRYHAILKKMGLES